jgi:hypothetical protein
MRVLRYEVPVDDQVHGFTCGEVLHVDCRQTDVVEFWALEWARTRRAFQVFETGQEIPVDFEYRGTTLSQYGIMVWHLFELS